MFKQAQTSLDDVKSQFAWLCMVFHGGLVVVLAAIPWKSHPGPPWALFGRQVYHVARYASEPMPWEARVQAAPDKTHSWPPKPDRSQVQGARDRRWRP